MNFNLQKYCLTVFFLLILNTFLFSQSEPCGTISINYDEYQKFKIEKVISTRNEYILPIKLHIITDNQGLYQADVDNIVREIELSSNYFESANIGLELCEIGYIQNSDLFNFDYSDGHSLISLYNKPDVINIYIVQTFTNQSGNSLCGRAFYPWSEIDLIIVNHNCATNSSTIAHEIGHYLGLYHTHRTFNGRELVNQSNCETAGDFLCDTPADPKLSSSNINSSCEYFGTETDDNEQAFMPNPESIMSYSHKWCRNTFTNQQGVIMRNVCDEFYSSYQCDENKNPKIIIFPNPTSSVINIVLSRNLSIKARLYTLDGLLVKETINQTIINIESMAEGIYILEIYNLELGRLSTEKIVITNK